MKRWLPAGMVLLVVLLAAAFLSASAVDPEAFTGQWYSCDNNCLYTFQNGLISCTDQAYMKLNGEIISGAYCFSADKVVVFAAGIEGLETERELHLIHRDGTPMLCENGSGTGKIFFCRDRIAAQNAP